MRSSLILLVTATLSHAYFYPADGDTRALVNSRHFRRNQGIGGDLEAKDVCVIKALDKDPVTHSIPQQVLSIDDLAHCQAQLLEWAQKPDNMIQNTGGAPGLQVTYQTVGCQVCNFGTEQHVEPDRLKLLFQAIHNCGTQEQPKMGFGYADGDWGDNGYYVSYAPAGHLQNCYLKKKTHDAATGLEDAD